MARNYEKIERAIRDIHQYETPQIIAMPVTNALDTYKDWVIKTSEGSKVLIQKTDNNT
ncbi:MAG: divalent cation tolerance protein CutA [Dissulfuribacterales bacterium]